MAWTLSERENRDDQPMGDQCVHLRGTFGTYEALLEARGEKAVPRISYLEGRLFIVTPSNEREAFKSLIGCLVETYCLCAGKRFKTVGSWTIKDPRVDRGSEPDESFVFDFVDRPVRPDLAIEVVWTSTGIDKLEIYRALGVPEVWTWKKGRISIHVLEGERYLEVPSSRVLPGIDVGELTRFLDRPTTFDAPRAPREEGVSHAWR